jgi:hypothetical protein
MAIPVKRLATVATRVPGHGPPPRARTRALLGLLASALIIIAIAACGSSGSTSSSSPSTASTANAASTPSSTSTSATSSTPTTSYAPGSSATSSGSSTPTGSYETTVTNEKIVNGVWTITFARRGSFKITNSTGGSIAVGKGSRLRRGILTIEPVTLNECGEGRAVGRYRTQLTGNQLQLIRIADPCKTRSNVLSYTFIKKG